MFSRGENREPVFCVQQRPVPAFCSRRRSLSHEGHLAALFVILLLAGPAWAAWAAWAGSLLLRSLLLCVLPNAACSGGRPVP